MQKVNCVMDILERERELAKEINLLIDDYEYWSDEAKKKTENEYLDIGHFCKVNADRTMEKINDKKKVLINIRRELAYTLKGYLD